MRDPRCQHSWLEQPPGPEEGGSRDCQLKAQTQLEGDVGSSRTIADGSPWEMQQQQWQISLRPSPSEDTGGPNQGTDREPMAVTMKRHS